MLRINHRHSKDVDLFVPDPQYLGYFSPRLTDAAEALTTQYEEAAEYLRLVEIGCVVDAQVVGPGQVCRLPEAHAHRVKVQRQRVHFGQRGIQRLFRDDG
ncbi:hypothetical protein LP417_24340 [Polaromonas sp. P1-6]|nr:hypothetical protein LP417_24340 [Polaromonas sp. P1-6]